MLFSGIIDRMDILPPTGPAPLQTPAQNPPQDTDTQENKDIAALSYVWILSIFVYLYKRQSPFVRFHAKQGLVLFALSIAFVFVPFVGRFLELIVLGFCVWGFLAAAQGHRKELPMIYALSAGDIQGVRRGWQHIVDAIVALWHKIRHSAPQPSTPAEQTPVAPPPTISAQSTQPDSTQPPL